MRTAFSNLGAFLTDTHRFARSRFIRSYILILLCSATEILPHPSNFQRYPPQFRIAAIDRRDRARAQERERERERERGFARGRRIFTLQSGTIPDFFRRASPRDSAAICQCKPAYLNWPRGGDQREFKIASCNFFHHRNGGGDGGGGGDVPSSGASKSAKYLFPFDDHRFGPGLLCGARRAYFEPV